MSATTGLLDFAAAAHALPSPVRADAIRLLADTLAVGAAGASAPGAGAVRSTAAAFGSGTDARLLGCPGRLPAPSAAYVNGFHIHCLEWDAVHEPAVVHALSVVTAALGAAIDRRGGCDPEEAITALVVGVDLASGLGIAADSALSFFRPATAGLIGAALAVARIEGMNRDQFADVLGMAYSHCAGTMQAHVEGSITLPLQIAAAARSAMLAVDLVKHGLTAPHDVLEGPFGYFTLFDKGDLSRYTEALGQVWQISEVSTKPFPSGRASHAVLAALSASALLAEEIMWIEVRVPPLIKRLVGRPVMNGMKPAYARLCLPLLAALMVRDGQIDPRKFTPETFADPVLLDLAGRVVVSLDDNPDPNALGPQSLAITFKDGRVLTRDIPYTLGAPLAPLAENQVQAKLSLARTLADNGCDARLFDDPLTYFTCPELP